MRLVNKLGRLFTMEEVPGEFDFWTCYENGWEDDTHQDLDGLLKDRSNPSFIDVGAWVGPISLWVANRCPIVLALEPDPVARKLLERNLMNNDVLNVVIREEALGDGNTINLGVKDAVENGKEAGEYGDSMTSSLYENSSRSFTVDTVTFQQLVDNYSLDPNNLLIKIDIEGGEADALLSNLEFIRQYRPPIHLSFHAPLFSDPTDYLNKMNRIFKELEDDRQIPEDFGSLII